MEKSFISGIKHFIYCMLALVPTCMHTRPNTHSGDKAKNQNMIMNYCSLQRHRGKYYRNNECN